MLLPPQFSQPISTVASTGARPLSALTKSTPDVETGDLAECSARGSLADILANGFRGFPIPPGQKRASLRGWTKFCSEHPSPVQLAKWLQSYPNHGIAIACGWTVIGVDIDEDDGTEASAIENLVCAHLGTTPLKRIGRAPRSVLVYRVAAGAVIPTKHVGRVDVIGDGAYFVGYGTHPDTGEPYRWPDGSPLTVPVRDLPTVTQIQIDRLIEGLADYYGLTQRLGDSSDQPQPLSRQNSHGIASGLRNPRIAEAGSTITDGRDSFLRDKVYQAFASGASTPEAIIDQAWPQFVAGADLTRPKRDGKRPWQRQDALAKANYLLRSGKPRPKMSATVVASPNENGAWPPEYRQRFIQSINATGAAGELSPTQVKISHVMTEFARHRNDCFASCETIAATVGCKPNTVKKARRQLRALGFWTAQQCRGGKGFIAHYYPNHLAVDRACPFSRPDDSDAMGLAT